jgi:hypothetical protein
VLILPEWTDKAEEILTSLGYPYDFERMDCDTDQLPDRYIVYFLVDDPPKGHADGKETSHAPRIQVSLYYRNKPDFLTIPDEIIAAFVAANFMRVGGGKLPFDDSTGHYGWRADFRLYERR